jgi:hypothetical protein
MYVPAKNKVGLEAIDPVEQIRIPKEFLSRPANARASRWRVMTPNSATRVNSSFSLLQHRKARRVTSDRPTKGKL